VCCVLCAVCCVLCAVCCVLCAVCCVLCAVCCVLCAVCCVLCAVCYVLCAVRCVLCAVCCVLCAVCCVLCAACCVLCVVCSTGALASSRGGARRTDARHGQPVHAAAAPRPHLTMITAMSGDALISPSSHAIIAACGGVRCGECVVGGNGCLSGARKACAQHARHVGPMVCAAASRAGPPDRATPPAPTCVHVVCGLVQHEQVWRPQHGSSQRQPPPLAARQRAQRQVGVGQAHRLQHTAHIAVHLLAAAQAWHERGPGSRLV
jgi:hypothetical protein